MLTRSSRSKKNFVFYGGLFLLIICLVYIFNGSSSSSSSSSSNEDEVIGGSLSVVSHSQHDQEQHVRLRVASYNLWNIRFDWEVRKLHIADTIRTEHPDLIAVQEVTLITLITMSYRLYTLLDPLYIYTR